MIFRLLDNCYLLGKRNTIIFNANDGKHYFLDESGSEILWQCERNVDIDAISVKYPRCKDFLDILVQKQLGSFYKTKIYIDKSILNSPITATTDVFKVRRVYVQFPWSCDLSCDYCQNPKPLIWQGCRSCGVHQNEKQTVSDIENIMKLLKILKPHEVIIRGGNPFLQSNLSDVLFDIKSCGVNNVTIIWNGLAFNPQISEQKRLAGLSVTYNIIFWGISEEDYEALQLDTNILKEQIKTMEDIKKIGAKTIISIILSAKTVSTAKEIKEFFWKCNCKRLVFCDMVEKKEDFKLKSDLNRNPVLLSNYWDIPYRNKYNMCLNGVISIEPDGNITPCPMIRESIGLLSDCDDIHVIDANKLFAKYWTKVKRNDSHCGDCGLNTVCIGCSYIEDELGGADKFNCKVVDKDTLSKQTESLQYQ